MNLLKIGSYTLLNTLINLDEETMWTFGTKGLNRLKSVEYFLQSKLFGHREPF